MTLLEAVAVYCTYHDWENKETHEQLAFDAALAIMASHAGRVAIRFYKSDQEE